MRCYVLSWLNIKGKIYHCAKCGTTIKVGYECGAYPTQIGDMNVFQQIALNKKYDTTINNQDSTEYYFHDTKGICERCFEEYGIKSSLEILNMFVTIRNYYEKYNNKFQIVSKSILVEYINNLSKEKFKEIDIESYDNTIGHKYFKLTFKRDKLIEEFLSLVREKILNELKEMLKDDIKLTKIIKSYNKKTEELNDTIVKSLREYKGKFFYDKYINETENLHDFIEYEYTVRKPVDNTPKVKFYYEVEYPKTMIRKELKSFCIDKWYCFDENELMEKVKERLYQVL